ncbi:restriction endonuclease S subunit [Spirochaetia bacterium]|nr:restriction endonuclease S subunit [Spirochaetia bacterium]
MSKDMSIKMKPSGIEWIGDIPDGWDVSKIKYSSAIIGSGTTPDSTNSDYYDGNLFWIQSGDLYQNISIKDTEKKINHRAVKENPALKCFTKDFIVIAMYGASVGNCSISHIDAYVNQACCCIKPSENMNLSYLFYFLEISKEEMLRKSIGGAQPNISQMIIKNLFVLNPPLSEQQAIALFLDERCEKIDGIIADMEQQIEVLKQYKTSLITKTVTKGLDKSVPMKDSSIKWIGKMPKHWGIKRLKYILKTPLQYGANETGEDFDASLPRYIRITDISLDNELKNEDKLSLPINIAKPYLLHDGDILFARSGATVGKSFIYRKSYGESAFAGYLIRAVCDVSKYDPKYIYYITLSNGYEQWLQMVFTQATIQNIGANKYENLIVTSAPLKEQQNMVKYLDEKCQKVDSLISDKQFSITTMKDYKKSLIYEYVTGKKRVTI